MTSRRATLLGEDLPALGPQSRPTSPWSSLSSILQGGVLAASRTLSNGYASRIPVLAGNSPRYQPFQFYSEIGDEEDLLEHEYLRFADPPPTLKSLHADGHKMNQGIDGDDDGLGDNAEVWDEYVEEAKEYDTELISELNGSLDVLLIFAGLFCAVLAGEVSSNLLIFDSYPAALIIESYKMLLPDRQDDNLDALNAILFTLRNSSYLPPPATNDFKPSSSAVRVNALWFGSLALTLGVAVQVMLAKQWLHKYGEGLSNVPRLRTQLRQYRYDSLRGWALPEMVNFLPTLLHLALALFLLGLIDFLWSIHRFVATITLTICVIFGSLYLLIMILPHFFTDCPYKTPFSRLLGLAFYRIQLTIHSFRKDMIASPRNIPLEQAEYQAIQARRDTLQAKALSWLMTNSRNPVVIKTITQSLASLTPSFTAIPILRQAGAIQRVAEQFLSCFTEIRVMVENDIKVQFQMNKEKEVEAGLYAKALVGLTEGLPASRWPQRPPRDLNLYANVLDSALSGLAAQTDDAEIVAFAVSAREHIFRAGRNRYPNSQSQNPSHSLGNLLDLVTKIANDELIPGVNGVVCALNTVRRCIEATALDQRFTMWTEFAQPLMKILADTPPNCRVRESLSTTFACFGGINHSRDYSDGHNPTEHRLVIALATLLVADARRSREAASSEELCETIADALRAILADYSRSFVHSISPLGDGLDILLPLLFTSQSFVVKRCCLEMVQHADYADLPPNSFANLMELLKDESQSGIHPELARVLERHLHRTEVLPFLSDVEVLRSLLRLLASTEEEVQISVSGLVLDICAMALKAGGKGAQRSALDPLVEAGLLHSLKDFFWHCSAILSSGPDTALAFSHQDGWVPRLLAILELYPDEVLASGIMDACIMLCQEISTRSGQGGTDRNLKEWFGRYMEWIESGKKRPRPRPKGPLHRRLEIS